MAGSYRVVDRDQRFLMPPDMAEWLPPDHLAWLVLDVVAEVDTSRFHARHPQAGPGRRAFDPDMLLALLVYAYAVGERSSRRIERLCIDHVAFRVLCAQDVPDHTTIARFRAAHEDAFAGLFTQVLAVCGRAGMGRVGSVAVDGTKIAADASMDANRGREWLEAEVARILAEAAETDAAEDDRFGSARGDELPAELADPTSRSGRIRACLEQVNAEAARAEATETAQREAAAEYLVRVELGQAPRGRPPGGIDPERLARARLAREEARLAEGVSNARRRRNIKSAIKRIKVTLARAEAQRALREAEAAEATTRTRKSAASEVGADQPDTPGEDRHDNEPNNKHNKRGPRANTTDPDSRVMRTRMGWLQGYNAQIAVSDDHLILSTRLTQDPTDTLWFEPMMNAATAAAEHLTEQHATGQPATADPEGERPEGEQERSYPIGVILADAGYLSEDNLKAPGPDRLIALGTGHQLHKDARAHPASGPPPEDASLTERMRHRLRTPEGHKKYKRRAATVETMIAHLKERIGLRRFSRRGTHAAQSELDLASAAANLLQLHARTRVRTA